jgi:hypothetical protein
MTEVVEDIRSGTGSDEHGQQHGEFGGDDGNGQGCRIFSTTGQMSAASAACPATFK